jgi:predicted DNA-binding transcriptional regulator YafY
MKTKEITQALGVSERMVRKYMNDLSEASVNVESIPGPNGGYELIGYDYLLNLDLKREEAIALQLATKNLKKEKFELMDELEALNNKINIICEQRYTYDDCSANIVIKAKPTELDQQIKRELEIQATCITKNKLRIKYRSISSGETTRVVRPYGIVTRNNLKYLSAYCERRKEILFFKIVRIKSIEVLDEKFSIPEAYHIKEHMKNQLGLFNENTYKLKLLIKKPFAHSVSEGIYGEDQKITWKDEESIIFEAKMKGKPDIIRWILSMRTGVTIIEPVELKEEIKNELQKMIDLI